MFFYVVVDLVLFRKQSTAPVSSSTSMSSWTSTSSRPKQPNSPHSPLFSTDTSSSQSLRLSKLLAVYAAGLGPVGVESSDPKPVGESWGPDGDSQGAEEMHFYF